MNEETRIVIKVSSASRPPAVAGAIAGMFRNGQADGESEGESKEINEIDVRAIGANAVYQAVKAISYAHRFLENDDIHFASKVLFVDLEIDGEERTALQFALRVERRGKKRDAERTDSGIFE